MWDSKPSLFMKFEVVSSLRIMDCHSGVGIYIKILSEPFIPALSVVGRAQLVFFRVVLCANYRFSVSMKGDDFKILLHYDLETELLCFLL